MKRYAVVKSFMRQCVAFCHNHLAPPFLRRKTPQRAAKTSHLASHAHAAGHASHTAMDRPLHRRTQEATHPEPLRHRTISPYFYNRLPASNTLFSSGSRRPRSRPASILHCRNGPPPSNSAQISRFPVLPAPQIKRNLPGYAIGGLSGTLTVPLCRYVLSAEAACRRRRKERFLARGKRKMAGNGRGWRDDCRVQVKLCCELLPQDKPR